MTMSRNQLAGSGYTTPTAFSRTLRLLGADRARSSCAGLLAAGGLLSAWCAWSLLAHVTLYEVTSTARIEVDRAIYPIQSPLLGRVTRTWLALGREVNAGDVLVELDASQERLQALEERARLAALSPQQDALRRQIAAEESAGAAEQRASQVAAEEARANARQAEVPATYSAAEEDRLRQLRAAGLIGEQEYQRGRANAQQSQFTAEREQIAVRRIEQEQHTHAFDRDSRIRALEAEIARLQGQMSTSRATIERLENEIARRAIRAPVAGRVGETASLRAGTVLHEGDRVAAIVPQGNLVIVAQFSPSSALGRIAPGQHAEVRLEGFPWTQYGSVRALVSRVATEVRDGMVRVDLAVDASRPTRIPLQHGLPGSVEVEVERLTPAALVLRSAGRLLAAPRAAETSQRPSGAQI